MGEATQRESLLSRVKKVLGGLRAVPSGLRAIPNSLRKMPNALRALPSGLGAVAGMLRAPLRSALVLVWALLIAVFAGVALWTQFAGREEAPAPEAARIVLPPARPPIVVNLGEPAPGANAEATPESAADGTSTPANAAAELATALTAATASPGTQPAPAERAASASPSPQPASRPAPAPAPGPPISLQPAPPSRSAAVTPKLPTARETTAPAWIRYGRPFDANDRRPRIAIVIGDLGLSSAATTAAIQQLPGEVTLAFSPYADGLENWISLARAAGHEVLLNLPMEPVNFPINDPGPRTLLTSLSSQQNLERLDWVLTRVVGYVGVTNQMGSRFTTMPDSLKPVLGALNERGLMFLDSRTTPRSVAAKVASEIGLPRAIVDRQIDQEASRPAIDGRLGEIERAARETGSAVAMAQPYPVTLERINAWLPSLEGKGFVLSPLTAIANRQADR